MDWSPAGPSVHGILQARILDWVATPFSRGSSPSRDQTWVSCIATGFSTIWATREAPCQLPHGNHAMKRPLLMVSCFQLPCCGRLSYNKIDPRTSSPIREAATYNPPDGAQLSKYSIKSSKAKNKLQASMLDLELGFTDHQSLLSSLWGAE